MKPFDQRDYWRKRLSTRVDLSTVGHKSLGEHYNQYLYARRLEVLQRAVALHKIDPRSSAVLDVGCGSGFYTRLWADLQARAYTGIDLSERAIAALSVRYPAYRFVCGDITDRGFVLEGGAFDVVTLFDVLYHITDNTRATKALENITAILKPDGTLFLFDQLSRTDDYQLRSHVKFRSHRQFESMLATARLQVVGRYPLFSILSPSIRGVPAIDLPVCSLYAAVGVVMHRVPRFGALVGRAALEFDRLMLDKLKLRPSNGELIVLQKTKGRV